MKTIGFEPSPYHMNIGKNWSSSLKKMVDLAMSIAQESQLTLKHGAVLFSKKQIHTSCCNERGNRICGYDVPSLHAEARCLKPINNHVSKHGRCIRISRDKHVLVVRITSDNQLTDSKPCCMCINLMKWHGIKKVYYSDADGNICCLKLNQVDEEVEVYASHGLKLMIFHCTCNGSGTMSNKKLPLTKAQKNYLVISIRKCPNTKSLFR